jgi:hypothetical protein|tara:strand:- start:411 stop:734 length:324 start_codon:yes stop_codon:yes gene_type:complete
MQPVYDYVIESVFRVYLLNPEALRVRLVAVSAPMKMTVAGLEFSLPQLYQFVSMEAKLMGAQSYVSFRRCLYGQQTQVILHALGAKVVIAQNHKNVNQSIYRLQALT